MTILLISFLTIQCVAVMAWGLRQRDGLLQFPVLMAAVFLGWLIPQLLGITNRHGLPDGALDKTALMAIFCMAACYYGYVVNVVSARLFAWSFDSRAMLKGAIVLSALGAIFFFKVGEMAAEVTAEFGGGWTGIITIYFFLSQMLSIGFAIALVLYLRQPSIASLSIVVIDLLFYLHRIFVFGRRAAMVELALMLMYVVWFNRRLAPPRLAMISIFIVGALVINSIGDYRTAMLGEDRASWSGAGVQDIFEIDFIGNLGRIFSGESDDTEVLNALLTVEATDRLFNFDYGLSLWNEFVFQFVPGQLVGDDVKRALRFDFEDPAFVVFGHTSVGGSTVTGLSDAFRSFWFFGAIKFFIIGFVMSRWYRAAIDGGVVAQIVIMLSVTPALHAVTHSTHKFFLSFVQIFLFIAPVLVFARSSRK